MASGSSPLWITISVTSTWRRKRCSLSPTLSDQKCYLCLRNGQEAGAFRDVIQNHLCRYASMLDSGGTQVLACLAMDSLDRGKHGRIFSIFAQQRHLETHMKFVAARPRSQPSVTLDYFLRSRAEYRFNRAINFAAALGTRTFRRYDIPILQFLAV